MSATNTAQLLTKEEAAVYLQISFSNLDRLIRQGILKPIKVGRSVRFTRQALENPGNKIQHNSTVDHTSTIEIE